MTPAEPCEGLYLFGCPIRGHRDAPAEVIGNKARNLDPHGGGRAARATGLRPPTAVCRAYLRGGRRLPPGTPDLLRQGVAEVEKATGLRFGGDRRPLLVSVRSGAAVSMPGMLDTLLNIGLCDRTLPALLRMTGNPRHAWDSYRRLVQSYAEVVHGLPSGPFEAALHERLRGAAVPAEAELDVADLKSIAHAFLDHYQKVRGEPFPQDPAAQLAGAVEAVFRSWEGARAVEYRRMHGLDEQAGTAATVQAMVFGNMGGTSGSGVAFTCAIRPRAKTPFTSTFCATPRGRTSFRAAARSRAPRACSRRCQKCISASGRWAESWSSFSTTLKTSSSPSRRGVSTSCRRGRRNAPPGRCSASPATWSPRA